MRNKHILIVLSVVAALAAVAMVVSAGDPDNPPGPPETTSSYRLEDIYDRLSTGAAGTQITFTEPISGPTVGTGHTLDEIMAVAPQVDDTNGATQGNVLAGKTAWGLTSGEWGVITGTRPYAPVPKTGQVISYTAGDDGDLEMGVDWITSTRFITGTTGTTGVTVVVTDTLTGLVWLQDSNCIANEYPGFDNDDTSGDGKVTWQHALDFVAGITVTGSYSNCAAGFSDWRLPNVREMQSLIDYGEVNPDLPDGHPFTGGPFSNYWSSTTDADSAGNAWLVSLYYGYVERYNKMVAWYVWPVRGGQ